MSKITNSDAFDFEKIDMADVIKEEAADFAKETSAAAVAFDMIKEGTFCILTNVFSYGYSMASAVGNQIIDHYNNNGQVVENIVEEEKIVDAEE
uniref:DUF3144 domain-containing protein n=1 Tax=Rhabditophanes sp. KR3021 TaxID=114890 RepID=A0AC35U960_9BILA